MVTLYRRVFAPRVGDEATKRIGNKAKGTVKELNAAGSHVRVQLRDHVTGWEPLLHYVFHRINDEVEQS